MQLFFLIFDIIPLIYFIFRYFYLAFITYGHHSFIGGKRKDAIISIFITIILAVVFTLFQFFEYSNSGFSISDGIFGTIFYCSTGLHGLVAVAPLIFLLYI